MRILSLLLLTIFLGKSCEGQSKQDLESAVIEYTANTRGFYQKITVQNQMVIISKDRSGQEKVVPTKIAAKDWEELVDYFNKMELDSLPKLKAPTEKRFYDGAPIANFKITFKDKTYETTSFDHGFPPKEIKKFVDKINSIAKQNDEN
ncbi:hypothetical protein [Flavobacterium frigoris]|uniref:Uncharacterized protein n=1 Tax=Flavobacterium frigoris TaxID=229204 RepID=A0A1H9CWU1_FLAFI|nr:hypothetical protein [Flavobacterium frigoris]SEQ05609.1 hypothetical protein SAMN05444355_101295 [Flavobacterium frigoris]